MRGFHCRLGLMVALTFTCGFGATPSPKAIAQLPLAFEPNQGQAGRSADFLARGAGYGIALRPAALTINLMDPSGKKAHRRTFDLQFKGASKTTTPACASY